MPKRQEVKVTYSKIIGFVNVWHKGRAVLVIQDRHFPKNILNSGNEMLKAYVFKKYGQELESAIATFVPAEDWGY